MACRDRRIAITFSRYRSRMRKEHTRREILAGAATVAATFALESYA